MSQYCIPEKLPAGLRRSLYEQRGFGGLEGYPGATGDKLRRVENLSSAAHPALAVRDGWIRYTDVLSHPVNGAVYHKHLYVASGTWLYVFRDNGSWFRVTGLEDSPKQMAVFNDAVYVFPDKLIFDTATYQWFPMDLDLYYDVGVKWDGDTLTYEGADWAGKGISAGDRIFVTVYGTLSDTSETFLCRVIAVSGDSMTLDRKPTMSGFMYRFYRSVPALEGVCAVKNRLWGYEGKTVYASEEGNPLNWYETADQNPQNDMAPVRMQASSTGNILACAQWQGYPVFFKEDRICKVLGSGTRTYELSEIQAQGVTAATGGSLCSLEGRLYYATGHGVYAYDGAYPARVDTPFVISEDTAVGGSDGRMYYLSCSNGEGDRCLYVYDPACRAWHAWEDPGVSYMTPIRNSLYMLTADGGVIRTDGKWGRDTYIAKNTETSIALQASAEFCDEVCCLHDGMRLHRLYLSCQSEEDSVLTVSVAYDGSKSFTPIATLRGAHDGWAEIAVPPVRCRYYRLRLEMSGPWRVYALHREYERGGQM